MTLFATNIAEATGVAGSGMIAKATDYMLLQRSIGEPMALFGGIVATLPGVLFYAKIRHTAIPQEALPDSLRSLFNSVCGIVGYASAEEMLKKGIVEYNLLLGRNLEITKELFVKNLREQEEKTLLNFIAGVFSKQVGPVVYRIYNEIKRE